MHISLHKGIKNQSEIIEQYLSVLSGKEVDWYTDCSYETCITVLKKNNNLFQGAHIYLSSMFESDDELVGQNKSKRCSNCKKHKK